MSILKKLLGYPLDEKELNETYGKVESNDEEAIDAKDRIVFEMPTTSEKAQTYADMLIDGEPLVINFEKLDLEEANQMIAFLSGVTYTIDGINLHMNSKIFIFSRKENLEDGSIMHFYNQYRRED
ncbi:cell division protein SepF [Mycoplasmatota bacterium WC44]